MVVVVEEEKCAKTAGKPVAEALVELLLALLLAVPAQELVLEARRDDNREGWAESGAGTRAAAAESPVGTRDWDKELPERAEDEAAFPPRVNLRLRLGVV